MDTLSILPTSVARLGTIPLTEPSSFTKQKGTKVSYDATRDCPWKSTFSVTCIIDCDRLQLSPRSPQV